MAKFNITSDSVTDWQFGPIRLSLDRRTKADDEDKEEYLHVVSVSRFRDHRNITAVSELSNDVSYTTVGVDGSFQGSTSITIDGESGFNWGENPTIANWFLQDTTLEPIESQGSTFVRESQEWTAESGEWAEGTWK
jgi:hypothetical protein